MTSLNLFDPNVELTKRIDLTADKNCVQTNVFVLLETPNKFSKGKTYLPLFVSVYAET